MAQGGPGGSTIDTYASMLLSPDTRLRADRDVIWFDQRGTLKLGRDVFIDANVLFEGNIGRQIRADLMDKCNLHTILRLPTGIFYAQGVKANVIFFDRKPASETPWTKALWIYDLRTNSNFTLKTNQLVRADLDEFVTCYNPANRHERQATWSEANPDGRWRVFTYDELIARDKVNLDIFWLRDESLEDSANLPEPDVLAREIVEELGAALEQFAGIVEELGEDEK